MGATAARPALYPAALRRAACGVSSAVAAAELRPSDAATAWQEQTGYSWDAVGRLAGLTLNLAGTSYDTTTTFTYNPASQIASSARTNDLYAWNGGVNVNRAYTANGLNQYSAVAGTGVGYDANGNLTSDGTNSYVYDVENRLVSRSGGGIHRQLNRP